MRRITVGAALAAALVPATLGLVGNATFSHSVPTPVPASAQLVPVHESPTGTPQPTRTTEPGDDHGGLRTTRTPEPGDDHGGLRTTRTTEPGDDHGGSTGSATSGTGSGHHDSSGRGGSGGRGSDDTHPDDSRP